MTPALGVLVMTESALAEAHEKIAALEARLGEAEHQLREATGHLAELLHCVPPAMSFERFGHLWGMAYWSGLEERIRACIYKVTR